MSIISIKINLKLLKSAKGPLKLVQENKQNADEIQILTATVYRTQL